MASICPRCHRVLEEEEICCAAVRYTWRCLSCFKLGTGFAVPYGKCFMCGGELEMIADRDVGDDMRFHAIHDAVQFEVDLLRFYEVTRQRATKPELCMVIDYLHETALDHLHELEEHYRAHLDQEMVNLASDEEKLLSDWPLQGIRINGELEIAKRYQEALEIERRARAHFRRLAGEYPLGLENELCRELAAEEDEHIAMLETELEQLA